MLVHMYFPENGWEGPSIPEFGLSDFMFQAGNGLNKRDYILFGVAGVLAAMCFSFGTEIVLVFGSS